MTSPSSSPASSPAAPQSLDDLIAVLEDLGQLGIPSARSVRLLDVGSQPYLDFFVREILEGIVAPGGATCRMYEGPYGSGKSHLLFLLREVALDHNCAVVQTDLSAAMKLEDWQLVTQHILCNLVLRTPGGTVRSLPRILESLRDLAADASAQHRRPLPHPGFERAMQLFASQSAPAGSAADLLEQFLLGERVRSTDLRRAGITGVKHPLNARNAEHVLRTVVGKLRRRGVKATLLLFDENEEVFRVTRGRASKRVLYGANLLRRLIDATASGGLESTAVAFGTLPGFLQSCAEAYPALGQRLELPGDAMQLSWRSPVVPIRRISGSETPEAFLTALVARLQELADSVNVAHRLDPAALESLGLDALESQAGDGYRRELVKRLAIVARLQLLRQDTV